MKRDALFLPSDILSDTGRIFRPSVRRWAPSLARQLQSPAHLPGDPRYTYEICALANNGSLLFALTGEGEFAEEICSRQVAWLHRQMQNGGGAQAASLAIQPWVNIGRLYRQRGQRDRALAQFDAIFPRAAGEPLKFGPFVLRPKDVLYEDVELLYVIDSLRTYHATRDYERGLRFARQLRPKIRSAAAIPRLDEYEYQFLLCRGYQRAAARALDRPSWEQQPQLMLINAFYRCILLADDSKPIVTDLANWVCGALRETIAPDHSTVRFALELARFAGSIEDLDLAAALIEAGYAASARHEDVPLQFEFAKLAADARMCGARNAVPSPETILVLSDYAGFARRHGLELSMSADARRALETLRGALQGVLW